MPKARVYKKGAPNSEYDRDQASPKAKKDRAARNKVHRELNPSKGNEVDHIDGNPQNNNRKNLRVVPRSVNRKKG